MKRMIQLLTHLYRALPLFVLLLLSSGPALAQSATGGYAGGDISYQMGNGDTLEVSLNYYLDCGGGSPGTNPFMILRNCSGTPIAAKNMGSPTITEISNTTQTTNCGAGTISGRRRYQYTAQIDISSELGAACNFYRLTISPNTRNVSQNLSSSTSQRMWLETNIYVLNDATNSSPVFGGEAIPYICSGSTVGYSPQVSDADGDSLRFSLVSAKGGTTSASNLTYSSGSAAAPISGISIDVASGMLTFTSPNDSGNYQVVVEVNEFDRTSGNQISRTYRDFQFHIDSTCTNDGPVPATAFTSVTNATTVGNDTVIIDTGDAAVFRLLFTDANGISGYTSNAVNVLGGNATFNTSNTQVTWTPGAADIGTHIFTISAKDNVTPVAGIGAHTVVVIVQSSASPFLVTGVTTMAQTCFDPANGQLAVSFSGGTGPFMFAVEGNFTGYADSNSTGLFTDLNFDVYRVYAIDSSDLSDTLTSYAFTILQNAFDLNSFTTLADVSCDDACDGSLRANPNGLGAGGASNYTYLWDDGQTTRIATSLCGGTRIVTITDTSGCALLDTAILFEPPSTFAALDSSDSASCFGTADGAAFIGAHGGVAASTSTSEYLIDQTEGSFEPYPYGKPHNVAASQYTTISLGDDAVSSTQNIGFSFDFFGTTYTQFRISSNGFITLGSTNTDNGCCVGETLPDNTSSPQSVIAAYWEDLNPNAGGTIETYRLNNGSNDVRVINFIRVPHFGSTTTDVTFQIVLNETSNIIQIFGDSLPSNGDPHTQGIENTAGDTAYFVTGRNAANWSATDDYVSFIPHQQTFNYAWSSIGSGASATNLTAGTYSVIATDGDGCGDTVDFVIEGPTQIDIDTTITQPSCQGDTDGQIAVTATGGNGGAFTFAWNTGATGSPLTNIGAGTYTVTATDVDGCEDSLTIVIADPAAVTITFDVDSASCFGGNDGQITATGAGGTSGTFTFLWSTTSTANPLTTLTAGTYTVTATDGNGCTAVDSATVLEPATAVTVSADSTDESCSGAGDGTASATGAGGTGTLTYAWSNGATTQNITGLTANTYTVTATDENGCTATASTIVNAAGSGVSISIVDSTDVSCNGGNDGQAVAGTPTGGATPYTIAWTTGATTDTISNLTAGTYTVTATDNNGCEGTDEVTIIEPATSVIASITVNSNATCNGGNEGSLTASGSGGTGTITFVWSNGATTATITGLTADNYTVTATDANGCTDTETQGISEPTAVSVSITPTQPTCSGGTGSAAATAGGGTGTIGFVWSNGATTATITGLTADTYTVTATDANGCTDTESTIISAAGAITIAFATDSVDCNGGSDGEATANVTGASGTISYAWSNSGSSQTITGLTAGNYTVTITDGNGCTATNDTTIFQPATGVGVAVGGTNVNCNAGNDGVAGALASGGTPGYTYAWSNGGSTDTITGLTAGVYRVTATDANGCTAVDSVTLTQPGLLFAGIGGIVQPTCNSSADGSLQSSGFGGTPGYTFLWNTGATTANITGLTGGNYTVTVTDANGCTDSGIQALSAPNAMVLTSDTAGESCNGAADGEAYVFVTGGTTPYTYAWNTGSTNDTVTGLTAGSYTVTVTDSNNCLDSITVIIDAGAGVTLSAAGTDPLCNGDTTGTATATATGAGTLTYAWSTGGNTSTITGLTANSYTVTVTDANGCTDSDTAILVDPTVLTVSAAGTDPACNGGTTGSATATGAGGTGTITYAWSTGGAGATITGLTADTYTVTATDANGCTATDTTLISDPTAIVATGSPQLHETCATTDGEATVSVANAQGTPTFAWSNGGTTQTITGLTADTYTVTVTDGSSCTDTSEVVILDTCACNVIAATSLTTAMSCAGDSATVTASATGGGGTYTFLWPGGATTATTQLPAGTWCVTVDDGSCTDTACIIIQDPNPITFSAFSSVSELSCDDACDGAGTANATGGVGTLFYQWSSGANTAAASSLCGGSYTVTVTDGNGCTNTAMFALVEPPSIWAVVDSTDSATCGGSDGEAYLSAYGGFAIPTSTATYVVDSTEGEFEPYGIGEPLNANSYETVTLNDDALSDTIEIFAGGNFSFFGSTETHFVVCSQGFITFDASNINSGQVNGMFSAPSAIPSTGANTPKEFIAGFWADLDPSFGAAQIETYEIGTAPNRARIVNFVDVTHFAGGGNTDTNTFQIVLYENSNIIQIHSTQLRDDGGSAVQGIENQAGTSAFGLASRNNTIFDADDDYVAFIPTTQAFTYTWSSVGTGSSSTSLPAGAYTVTVDDGNTCTDVVTFDIFELPSTVDAGLSVDAGVSCTGTTNTGELSVTPSGGTGPYTQLWSTGATGTSISSLAAGTYSVIVTDNNGCQDTATVTLAGTSSSIASPTILTNDTSVCANTSLLLQGQTNGTSTWTDTTAQLCTNTSGGIVTAVFSNVPATANGNATLSVTGFGDLDGLFFEDIDIIDENSGAVGTYDGSNTQCAVSTETFSITAANINTWAANNVISFVFDADFLVTTNSCSGNAFCVTAALTFPTVPDTSYWFGDPLTLDTALAIGSGDTVTVIPTTSTSYYYSTFNGVCWSEPDTVDVTILPTLTASITQNTAISCPGDSASVTASGSGGGGTYSFTWPTGETTASVNLPAGTWCVTVDDGGGTCSDTACVILVDPTGLTVSASSVDPLCNGQATGSATATPTGGTGTITYAWSNGGAGAVITGLTADTYTVTATDGNGCTATDTTVVDEPTPFVLSMTSDSVSCNGGSDGEGCAALTGGTPNYSYLWSNGATGICASGLAVGTYTVTITDANGCQISDTVAIFEPAVLMATIDSTDSNDCFGAAEGIAYASGSGGTAPYSFAWPNGSTSDTSMNLTAGIYIVTITDDEGCTATATAVITQPAAGMTISITNTDSTLCNGDSTGAATALAVNGSGTITYQWSNGNNTATTTTGLSAGTYGVTSTDASGCTASTTATIFEPNAIIVVVSGNDPSCNGEDDGDASATVTNGVGTLTYNWSNGAIGTPITGLTADTYIVVVTDANGCTGTDTVILADPAGMSATFSGVVESSCTSCTGEATVAITGGAATLSYLWPNGQTSTSATVLCDGINEVTVTDGNGCVDSFAVAIPSDSADTVIAMGTDPLCAGVCDGVIFTSNTCTGCTFIWTDSATNVTVGTTDTVSGRCAGTYIVAMTNAGGCTSFDTVSIADPAGVSVAITSFDTVSCLGGNDGTATALATGGSGTITYQWSNGNTGTLATLLTAGTFTVYATDANGCLDSAQVIITEPATGLSVVASIDSNVSCNGDNDGGASATAAGGSGTLTYTWNGALNGTPITGLTAGTYVVVVSDAGSCTATDSVTILEPTAVVGVIDSTINPTCPGDTNGTATVHGIGGSGNYTYMWPSGNTGTTEIDLSDGTYCVTITDDSGCVDILCVNIVDPTGMSNTFSGITLSSCTVCDGDATANVTGGNGTNYTYLWGNGQTTAANDSLCAGVNNVTITDSLGCTLIDAVAISADGADTVFADSIDATCGSCDGTVYATYNCNNGPCTVNWTAFGSTTSIGTTDTINNLCAGTYFVELTNNGGCVSTAEVEVISPDPIDPDDTITNESCSGAADGAIGLTPTGGSGVFTYAWSNSAGNVATNTGLTAGTYTVTISDNAGCDTIVEFIIDAPTGILIADTSTNASCFGICDGTITLTPSGGGGSYSYNWSPIPGNGQGVQAATGLCAGDYMVTVSDINGCEAYDTITITSPNEIIQDTAIVVDATCGDCDGTITSTISGGGGGFNYAWTNGDTTNVSDSLCFGFYQLTVTDANGCFEVFGYPVSETDGPEISLTAVNASALGQCDGTATVTVTSSLGTVVYAWSNGDTTQTADSLCAGLVVVTVTDTNGCSSVDTITIFEPDAMALDFDVTDITCEDGPCNGEITANVAGGVLPYSFAWSNGDTTQTITGLCAGTYTVTVTDDNGTIIIDSVTLDSPSAFTIVANVTELGCPGTCDGVIDLTITGTSTPMILWSTGDTTNVIDSLCAGTYTVTISDTSGCDDSLTFVLTSPPDITIALDSMTEPDCQQANGSISVSAGGGTGSTYGYRWLDIAFDDLVPNQTTSTAINLFAGIYNVEITDSNGCLDTFNFILNNNNAPDIALDSLVNVSCFGECDGSISITLSGGTSPYVTQWSTGTTTMNDSNLCAGFDTLAVADANLCLAFAIYEIVEPAELILEAFDITSVACGSNCDGTAEANASGGSAPYSYSWNTGATDSALTGLCAGVYDVTITDANGCTVSGSANVGGPTALVLTVDTTEDATCDYTGDGNIFITVTGGTPGYTYSWMDADSNAFASQDLTNILAGTYMLTITDAAGCAVSDTFEINSLNFVSVDVDDDFEVCPESRGVPITGTDSLATSVRWINASGIVQSNSSVALVDISDDTNMFVFEGTNGVCVARDTIYVYETDGPGLSAGENVTIEPGDEVTIGGSPTVSGGISVTWSPDKDISSLTDYNPLVNPLKTTVYYVTAIDPDNCFGIDSVVVTVEKIVDPVGGFSPNGDGVNEFFVIDRISKFPNATVQIFNRWGNLIFESAPGYTTPWDGTYKGNSLPVGTYYFVIDLKDDDVNELVTGPVSILK